MIPLGVMLLGFAIYALGILDSDITLLGIGARALEISSSSVMIRSAHASCFMMGDERLILSTLFDQHKFLSNL